jgi:predicted dehydrogenase
MDSHTGSHTGSHADPQTATPAEAPAVSSVPAADGPPRVRLAILGLDRSGQFHAERLSLRPEFEIVAVCDPSDAPMRRLPGLPEHDRPVSLRLEDLWARPDVDTVLIAGPAKCRAAWAVQALAAGKHVCLDAPPCENGEQMRAVLAAARSSGKRVAVLSTRRSATEFRMALEIVQSERLGEIYSARLLSWGRAVPVDMSAGGPSPGDSADAEPDVDLFAIFAWQYVGQLLRLVTSRPRSVFARILPPSRSEALTAFTLSIAFEPGVDALIDVNLVSGAALHTGWMLAGARGGYAAGRIYLHDESGEICDAPVSPTDLREIDPYGDLLARPDENTGPGPSANAAERVLRVIDAARESSRSGQSVPLDL